MNLQGYSQGPVGIGDPVVQEIDSHGSRTEQIDRSSQGFIEVGNAARPNRTHRVHG